MANWSSNNRACTTTWTTLRILNQISPEKTFGETGSVKMEELTFWNPLSSAEIREIQAKTLAIMMDNIFRMVRRAEYEKEADHQKATDAIVNTMVDADKTIADLAEINDKNYLFWKETENA